jgi:hypothetical protein
MELKGKSLNTSFLLAPFWLKANIKNVMIKARIRNIYQSIIDTITVGFAELKGKQLNTSFLLGAQVISPPVITLILCASSLSKIPSVILPPIFFNTFLTLFTNSCESFHHNFNDSMYKARPNLFVFLEKRKEFQSMSEVDKNL